MGISANLSDLLQKDSLNLGSAARLIQATIDTFDSLCTDDSWNLLCQALAFARHLEIEIVTPRRTQQRQLPAAINNYAMTNETIESSTTSNSASSDSFKVDVYFPTIDVILTEMRDRFSDINISLVKSINCLNPKSKNFLKLTFIPLLDQYNESLCTGNFQIEIMIFLNFLARNLIPEDKKDTCYHLEKIDPIKEMFPLLRECLMVTITFGTSTATVECSFSSLCHSKT